jgi:HEAT repeat protein
MFKSKGGWEPKTDTEKALYFVAKQKWSECVKIGKPAVEPLIEALRDKNSNIRKKAAETLDKIGWEPKTGVEKAIYFVAKQNWNKCVTIGQPALGPLIKALRDKNSNIREKAAETLGRIGDRRAVEPLIKALGDENLNVREKAAEALGYMGDSRAVEPLIIVALKDEDWWVRNKAAEALVNIGKPAVEPLSAVLEAGYATKEAAEALANIGARIGDSRAIRALFAASWYEYPGSMEVLSPLTGLLEYMRDTYSIEPLIEVLKDKFWWVRKEAADALDIIGWEPKTDTEKALYFVAKQKWSKCVKIGQPAVEPLIIIALCDNRNSNIREKAAEALDKIGWKPTTDTEKALYFVAKQDWSECVRIGKPVVEPLLVALRDEEELVRLKAAEALGRIGDRRAVEPLIEALGDENLNVREKAAEALAKIGQQAVEPLIEVLRDKNSNIRKKAAEALGRIGDSRAVRPLIIVASKDESWWVQGEATKALVKIGKPAVEPLIEALRDKNSNIRKKAAEALGRIGWKTNN